MHALTALLLGLAAGLYALGVGRLWRRAGRIVAEIAGCSADEADRAVRESGGNVKFAVLALKGIRAEEAEKLLAEHNGSLGEVLKLTPPY